MPREVLHVTKRHTRVQDPGRSPHTRRAYASDLAQLLAAVPPALSQLTPAVLRTFSASQAQLATSTSTRARRQASVASFCAWAFREELLDADPMGRVGDHASRRYESVLAFRR